MASSTGIEIGRFQNQSCSPHSQISHGMNYARWSGVDRRKRSSEDVTVSQTETAKSENYLLESTLDEGGEGVSAPFWAIRSAAERGRWGASNGVKSSSGGGLCRR
jgi:hypothetical protein